MKKMYKIFVALVVLSMMVASVGAIGNLSPGVSNSATTQDVFSIDITSPTEGQKISNENINLIYTKTGTGTANYTLNGIDQGALADSPVDLGALAKGDYTVEIVAGGVPINSVNFTVDRTAPADVTDLTSSGITVDSITWSWTNPTDLDFNNTRVTVVDNASGVPVTGYDDLVLPGMPEATDSITVIGLNAGTEYKITVRTEDDATTQ